MKEFKTLYKLTVKNPHQHYLNVETTLNQLQENQDFIDVKIPVWTPGSYLVREYAQHVHSFFANDFCGNELKTEKINKNTWRIFKNAENSVRFSYLVYAFELTVRTSFVNSDFAFVVPAAVFMFTEEAKNEEALLKIELPETWQKISTGLPCFKENTYKIDSFDTLVDSPITLGNQKIYEFEVAGKKHTISVQGLANYNEETFVKDFKKIVETELEMFGDLPYENYTFLCHFSPNKYGGLEHLNSCALLFDGLNLSDEKEYKKWLALVCHEYFHLWNVKRIRPVELGPFDYESENYTKLLWIAEGITSYYDDYLLKKAGLISEKEYLEIISENIKILQNSYGRKIQSVEDSSFDAWIKFYRPNENSTNTLISYYNKGGLVMHCLDFAIRNATESTKSLDDVMRRLYGFYRETQKGITKNDFVTAVKEVSGSDFPEIFTNYLEKTVEIDFEKYFSYAGLEFGKDEKLKLNLGIDFDEKDGKLVVTKVFQGTKSWDCDINVNDEIIGLNGIRANKKLVEKFLANAKEGENFKVLISRNLEIRETALVAGTEREKKYELKKMENPTLEQEEFFKKWLS
ncbi:M61 family metallopeptidase [bacterium]|nr:M61 family metallopeptidase [bacterium]